MSKSKGELVSVKIIPNEQGNPPGKLADAEVVFEAESGPLSGMKLIGFAVWERRDGGRNVTFPARQYSVNGERRSFALLRPIVGRLRPRATLETFEDADHSFHVPARTGRKDAQVRAELLDTLAAWIDAQA